MALPHLRHLPLATALLLGAKTAQACECMPGPVLWSPGGDLTGAEGPLFLDLGDRQVVRSTLRVNGGRRRGLRIDPYGLAVVRLRPLRPWPVGAVVSIEVEVTEDGYAPNRLRSVYVVGAAPMPAPGGAPAVTRQRNSNFCGTTETLSVQWPQGSAGTYGFWTLPEGAPAPTAPPALVAVIGDPTRYAVDFAVQRCDGPALRTAAWEAPQTRGVVRPIGVDGALGPATVFPLPPAPVETWSGLN